jgi:murein DD-endopeptidase MepM/ murein hydrolase activator NlpD
LDKPGELPPQPIIVEPSNVTDEGGKPALSGPPRMIGFPNVILALDADQVETANLPFSEFTPSMADSVIESALKVGSLRKTDEKDKFLLPSDSSGGGLILTRNELRAAFTSIRNQLLGSSNQPSTTQASTSTPTSTPTATPKEASFKAADPLPSDREAFSKIDALVENGKVTSGFGQRWGKAHKGIDIAAPPGSRVNAAYDGSVRYVGTEKGGITVGYGLFVILDHGKGVTTLYGHLKEGSPLVKNGDKVKQGQQIAGVGNTGHSTGPHLHYEYRLNGKSVNPVEVG